ncbi:MAG: hypothetical protein WEE89_05845 [Gemmatimonadota bacterium]
MEMFGRFDLRQVAGEDQTPPHDSVVTLAAFTHLDVRIKAARFPDWQAAIQILGVSF